MDYYNYDPGTGRFLSEDPIGFKSGDVNHYRYVRNNPLLSRDPSGLILEFGCEKSRLGLEDHLKKIENSNSNSKEAKALLELLRNDKKTVYKIYLRTSGNSETIGNNIYINPNADRSIETTDGRRTASIARVLAHELGHLTGAHDDEKNTNINKWENPIMTPIDGMIRTGIN